MILEEIKVGCRIWVRGPFGNTFGEVIAIEEDRNGEPVIRYNSSVHEKLTAGIDQVYCVINQPGEDWP